MGLTFRGRAALAVVLSVASAQHVGAQQILPPSIDPGRLPQQFQAPVVPRAAPEPVLPQPREGAPPPESERVRLTLDRIAIEGSTVYSEAALEAMAAPFLGHEIALADLFRLAEAISARYRADGYILSRVVVPAQRIGRSATLSVVEGAVTRVTVVGPGAATARPILERIRRSTPLHAGDLERYLLLANDLPGMTARGVLSPSPDTPGGSDLLVTLEEKLVDLGAGADNRGTKFIGPAQFYLSGALNNRMGQGERIAVRGVTTPRMKELRYGELTTDFPIGVEGTKLFFLGSYTQSEPGFTLDPLLTESEGTAGTLRLSHPFIRSRTENLTIRGGFDYRDSATTIFEDRDALGSFRDHLRVVRAGGTYDLTDRFEGVTQVSVEASQGLPFLGASPNEARGLSRPGARSEFQKLTLDMSRLQSLAFLGRGLTLFGAFSAQRSLGDALLASEQFGLGGPTFLRGYDPSEVTGDNGWAGKLELQWSTLAGLAWLREVQLYGFADMGKVWDVHADTVIGGPHLASAGTGVRFTLTDNFLGSVEVAKPLTRIVETYRGSGDQRPTRVFFTLFAKF
jgi:hemolysin activation/secretion protein